MNKKLKKLFNFDVNEKYDLTNKNILCNQDVYFPLNVVEYLMENDFKVDENTFHSAIDNCDIDMVTFLFYENCPFDKYSTFNAADNGILRLLEIMMELNYVKKDENNHWIKTKIYQNNFIYNNELLEIAKDGGCPDCIEYIQEILE